MIQPDSKLNVGTPSDLLNEFLICITNIFLEDQESNDMGRLQDPIHR